MDRDLIYLDHASTTPIDPDVFEAMSPFFLDRFGNPSSIHGFGREVRAALDRARDEVALAIGAEYSEITFTSGGTEANNLAILGAMRSAPPNRRRLVVSAVEHPSVLEAARALEKQGFELAIVPCDAFGIVHPAEIERLVDEQTALLSVMVANNEIGAVQDLARIARIARDRGALFHTDAVQALGVLPVDVEALGCDLLTVSAHKVNGPKAVGALFARQGLRLEPLAYGGSQERERRPGTENAAGIVGFGVAARKAAELFEQRFERLAQLRERFLELMRRSISGFEVNGGGERTHPGILNVSFDGVDGASLLILLDRQGLAAASGAACSSGSIEPSHVLRALGLPERRCREGVRFSFGASTTESEIEVAAVVVQRSVEALRSS
jgi:cysteine desulfurase